MTTTTATARNTDLSPQFLSKALFPQQFTVSIHSRAHPLQVLRSLNLLKQLLSRKFSNRKKKWNALTSHTPRNLGQPKPYATRQRERLTSSTYRLTACRLKVGSPSSIRVPLFFSPFQDLCAQHTHVRGANFKTFFTATRRTQQASKQEWRSW